MEDINVKNIDNEGFTGDKVKWFFDVIKGDVKDRISYRLEKFGDFDIVEAQKHFGSKIEGILIDIDDCIAPAYGDILDENTKKIEELLGMGIKVGFLSNGINGIERTKYLVSKGAVYCNTKESKPSKGSFVEACEMIGTKPQNTLMAGDDISKDGGALQLGKDGKPILLGFIPVVPIGNSYSNIPLNKWGNYTGKKLSRGLTNYINREKQKEDYMLEGFSFNDKQIEEFCLLNVIDKENIKFYFKLNQKAKDGYPNLWNKRDNFDYLLSLHKKN